MCFFFLCITLKNASVCWYIFCLSKHVLLDADTWQNLNLTVLKSGKVKVTENKVLFNGVLQKEFYENGQKSKANAITGQLIRTTINLRKLEYLGSFGILEEMQFHNNQIEGDREKK